jgi:hypothetical protein
MGTQLLTAQQMLGVEAVFEPFRGTHSLYSRDVEHILATYTS